MSEVTEEGTPRKKKRKLFYKHYQINGGSLKRLLPFCERCGSGYLMADHGDRFTCGHCNFTRYKSSRKDE